MAASSSQHIAVDCGAESSRVMVVELDHECHQAQLHEIHRFPTRCQQIEDQWHWRWQQHVDEVRCGVAQALIYAPQACSVACDTWGVDFVCCDDQNVPLAPPRCYRDPRGLRGQQRLDRMLDRGSRFRQTGCAQLPINTLDQLAALAVEEPELLAATQHLHFLPDHLAGVLSGMWNCERSIAATSSCTLAGGDQWHQELLTDIGINPRLFSTITASGRILGPLLNQRSCQVIASAGHDTAAAVAALPNNEGDSAYLSCGTWSLLGIVVDRPVVSNQALAAGFSNEAHWDGRVRLNRNIMGLWILQQCRRDWQRAGQELSYEALTTMAATVPDPACILEVDDQRFLAPSSDENPMLQRVLGWYDQAGQALANHPATITRAILGGLAQAYARALEQLQELSGRRCQQLVMLGGGGRNALLRELSARACGIPVIRGPEEATALGNALIQAQALGLLTAEAMPAYARACGTLADSRHS